MSDARKAIEDAEIDSIELLYVHNLPESVNVTKELHTVQEHLQRVLQGAGSFTVTARELGASRIESLFQSQDSHIDIKDPVHCPEVVQFAEDGDKWRAYVLSVPGTWLNQLFVRYGESLFSANYRGFLGITRRRRINTGTRTSAETRPQDFWVFNNGITLLTLGVESGPDSTTLAGISIINGAQTTGSIGSVDLTKYDLKDVRVLCRIIKCSDPETIESIVKFNNTQNEIMTWDQFSNDPEQARVESEFAALGHAYSRKRGFLAKADQISVEEVAQPVVAFGGRFSEANRGKNRVFERKQSYTAAFTGKKARHILFAYALARAIDERRTELKTRSSQGIILKMEDAQLRLLRNLRFKYFLVHVTAHCLEAALGTKVDLDNIGFTTAAATASKYSLIDLVVLWSPVVEKALAFVANHVGQADVAEIMSDEAKTQSLLNAVEALFYTTRDSLNLGKFPSMVAPT